MRKLLLIVFLFAACRCATTSDFSRKSIDDAIKRSVWVDTTLANGNTGNCSGVVIETGKVLTAKHCAGTKMTVNGVPAQIIATDDQEDLVLLRVVSPEYARVTVKAIPSVGDRIFSVATISDLPSVYSQGVVMKLASQYGDFKMRPMVSVQAPPGVSGGGVYDTNGNLVGVVVQYRVAPFPGPHDSQNYALACGLIVDGAEIARFLKEAKA